MEKKIQPRKKGPSDSNVTITAQKAASFYVFVAKQALSNFDTIELHALGLAMTVCVSTADLLVKYEKTQNL